MLLNTLTQVLAVVTLILTLQTTALAGEDLDLAFAKGMTITISRAVFYPAGNVAETLKANDSDRTPASKESSCSVVLKSSSSDDRNLHARTMPVTRIYQPTDKSGVPSVGHVTIEVEDTAVKHIQCVFDGRGVTNVADLMAGLGPLKMSLNSPKAKDI